MPRKKFKSEQVSQAKKDLEKNLNRRPPREKIIAINVIRGDHFTVDGFSPALIGITEKLVWEKRHQTMKKLVFKRPPINELIAKGIFQERDSYARKQKAVNLDKLLKNRPPIEELKQKGLLRQRS